MSCTCGASLMLPSCADVAMSDRKQLKIFSDDYLYSKAFPAYENFKMNTKLVSNTTESNKIVNIGLSIRDSINAYYASRGEKNPTENFTTIEIDPVTGEYFTILPEWIVNEQGWYEGTKLNIHEDSGDIIISEADID